MATELREVVTHRQKLMYSDGSYYEEAEPILIWTPEVCPM